MSERKEQNGKSDCKSGNRPCDSDIEQNRARSQWRANTDESAKRADQSWERNEKRQRC